MPSSLVLLQRHCLIWMISRENVHCNKKKPAIERLSIHTRSWKHHVCFLYSYRVCVRGYVLHFNDFLLRCCGVIWQSFPFCYQSSYPVWEDFSAKATKLHSQLRWGTPQYHWMNLNEYILVQYLLFVVCTVVVKWPCPLYLQDHDFGSSGLSRCFSEGCRHGYKFQR